MKSSSHQLSSMLFYFIRPFTDLSKVRGHGVRLIDFGRAIDMQPFPKGSKFTGSNATDNFQCVQMIDNTPWTYQVINPLNYSCSLDTLVDTIRNMHRLIKRSTIHFYSLFTQSSGKVLIKNSVL